MTMPNNETMNYENGKKKGRKLMKNEGDSCSFGCVVNPDKHKFAHEKQFRAPFLAMHSV